PHIVVTTPESLYILLTSERGRAMLRATRTVIVDEIHALVGNKRGSHLALSLERLDALAGGGLVRIGLSATQRPITAGALFLVEARGGTRTANETHEAGWSDGSAEADENRSEERTDRNGLRSNDRSAVGERAPGETKKEDEARERRDAPPHCTIIDASHPR